MLIVLVLGFAGLAAMTTMAYRNAPPIPAHTVDAQSTSVLSGEDISAGQAVFLKYGLMDNGSIWGHGAYLGPDYAAAALHRIGESVADAIAQRQFQQPLAALTPGQRAAVHAETAIDALFTKNKPVIFNFHGYPWLIHKFTYRRTNHSNIHVHGYKEKGNINTPLELAIQNQVDHFNLAIDVIDRVPRLHNSGAHLKEWLKGQIIESINYAHANGVDKQDIQSWKWIPLG